VVERALAQHITPELLGRAPDVFWIALSEIGGKQRRQRFSIICGGPPNVHVASLLPCI
jgi:hypothetical protein